MDVTGDVPGVRVPVGGMVYFIPVVNADARAFAQDGFFYTCLLSFVLVRFAAMPIGQNFLAGSWSVVREVSSGDAVWLRTRTPMPFTHTARLVLNTVNVCALCCLGLHQRGRATFSGS
jgi:hypothetical protein